ncbi:cytochrome c3 family protein [Geomonas nitrogeniifigens]|uniref:Cytochrome c3 family protein n=1 Tax=Geomonas diazotrophica TaxID=2843197 RepID=A0ABX8JDR9_9BACT|nr:cytochrome c3 family protein [Geomonas nitrogeniifigens]QWV96545.1 cytochrome c3 family protein [Geomonas nitrogeniifigens]QXE85650.1 cytochrome c3 family protein [Geomonas nitrogeniifigens]
MIRKNTLAILLLASLAFLKPVLAAPVEQPETVCIQCHGTLPDRLGAPVKLWRSSIHADNGISCNGCHGGDPKDAANAMTPQRGFLGAPKEKDIPAFCGRCHPGVYKDYLSSAHGRALGAGGPTCVTCHGNHQVVKASLALINEKSCTRCHSFDRAKAIRDAMQQTEGYIDDISRRIADFQVSGVDTEKMGKSLFSVRNRFHTLFHDVDVARVKGESAAINKELGKLDAALKEIEQSHQKRRVAGGIAVGFMVLLALLFHLMKKSYD